MLGELAQGKLGCGVTQPTLSFIAHVCEKRFGKHGISLQVMSTRRNVSQVLESRGNLRTLNTSSQSRPRKRAVAVGRHGRQQSFEIQLPFLHSSCPKFAAVTSQRWTEIANCKCNFVVSSRVSMVKSHDDCPECHENAVEMCNDDDPQTFFYHFLRCPKSRMSSVTLKCGQNLEKSAKF